MSTVSFDAPQSIGDELLDQADQADETSQQIDETIEGPSETIPEVDETIEDEQWDEDKRWAERALWPHNTESDDMLSRIWNAEQDCRRREARVEMLKEEIKEAKAQLEQAVINLRQLCSDMRDGRRQKTVATLTELPSNEVIADNEPASETAPEETQDLSWRETPLAQILTPAIKGLGEKKKESLIEACPTLGDFEDLRGRVGKDAAELHELLPKGIGLETASILEERLLDWIAKGIGADVATVSNPITRRAAEINTGSENCLATKHPEGQQWWQSGWESYGRQLKLEECPYLPGDEQDDWLRGWLSHFHADEKSTRSQDVPQAESVRPWEPMCASLDDL